MDLVLIMQIYYPHLDVYSGFSFYERPPWYMYHRMKIALVVLFLAPFLVAAGPASLPELYGKMVMAPIRSIFRPNRVTAPIGQFISNTLSYFPVPSYGRPTQPQPQPQPQPAPSTESHGSSGGHSHFGYDAHNGPETWPKDYPSCGGSSQSPIDINVNNLEKKRHSPVIRQNYWAQPESMTLENNGHTLEVSGEWPNGKVPSIKGGPLPSTYQFKQLHIHWGLDDNQGSEHTVNGQTFPMEMHVVHWNTKYGSYDNAVKNKDGLAVAGYFFEITDIDNPMLEQFIRYTKDVAGSKAKEVKINDPLPIGILDLDTNDYITYQGSLTTPPCSEIVTWIMSTKSLGLSRRQMSELRGSVKENGELMHNFRPTQPLNGRTVYVNY